MFKVIQTIINPDIQKALGIDDLHVRNLLRLANYLIKLPEDYEHFEMDTFLTIDYYNCEDGFAEDEPCTVPKEVFNRCGTIACAVGHTPMVPNIEYPVGESMEQYQHWVNVLYQLYAKDAELNEDQIYRWCFAGEWSTVDNTPKGAAQRILYMLTNGVPDRLDVNYDKDYSELLAIAESL